MVVGEERDWKNSMEGRVEGGDVVLWVDGGAEGDRM